MNKSPDVPSVVRQCVGMGRVSKEDLSVMEYPIVLMEVMKEIVMVSQYLSLSSIDFFLSLRCLMEINLWIRRNDRSGRSVLPWWMGACLCTISQSEYSFIPLYSNGDGVFLPLPSIHLLFLFSSPSILLPPSRSHRSIGRLINCNGINQCRVAGVVPCAYQANLQCRLNGIYPHQSISPFFSSSQQHFSFWFNLWNSFRFISTSRSKEAKIRKSCRRIRSEDQFEYLIRLFKLRHRLVHSHGRRRFVFDWDEFIIVVLLLFIPSFFSLLLIVSSLSLFTRSNE